MGFTQHLRERGESELAALLEVRPDLATPPPSSVPSLAARAASRVSLDRALADLDAWSLQVLEAVLGLGDGARATDLASAVGATDEEIEPIVRSLLDRALLWTADPVAVANLNAVALAATPGLNDVLGPYPAGLGPPLAATLTRRSPASLARLAEDLGLAEPGGATPPVAAVAQHLADPATVTDLLKRAPGTARRVLTALTWGPPVGHSTGSADDAAASPARGGVQWLVRHGLLATSDAQHVVLPREVGLALRGGHTHREPARRPAPAATPADPLRVDGDAVRHAEEMVRLVGALLVHWGIQQPPVLRSGGLGVRELRRLAAHLGASDTVTTFVVELAGSADLVADDGGAPPTIAPTSRADDWLAESVGAAWQQLAAAWLASERAAWLVGTRDDNGVIRAALDPELRRPWVARLRAATLGVLRDTHGALDAEQVLDVLRWRAPRTAPAVHAVQAVLDEATLLGVIGAGALSSAGRALIDGGDAGAALQEGLPPTVDEVVLQGDLTGVVPGRPARELAALLEAAAEVESRGSALTVRFTESTIRAALDAGLRAEDLLAGLSRHARAGVPQPLEYLVLDVARRHGRLRVGMTACYVRSDDPALLAGLVADRSLSGLGPLLLAPTVLAVHAPIGTVLAALRERGLAPVAEDDEGQVVVAGAAPRRIRSTPAHATPPPEQLGQAEARSRRLHRLAADLLSAERRAPSSPAGPSGTRAWDVGDPAAPAFALELLREAAVEHRQVWLDVVGQDGTTMRRRVRPVRVDAGRVRVLDLDREAELTIAVHRIIDVNLTDTRADPGADATEDS
jgi:hypothetical protein